MLPCRCRSGCPFAMQVIWQSNIDYINMRIIKQRLVIRVEPLYAKAESDFSRTLFVVASNSQNTGVGYLLYGWDNSVGCNKSRAKNSPITIHLLLLKTRVFRLVIIV